MRFCVIIACALGTFRLQKKTPEFAVVEIDPDRDGGRGFNNGNVDACYMSALAYQPFELWRGMSNGGGVVDLPLAMATLQIMVRHEKFPADFACLRAQTSVRSVSMYPIGEHPSQN